MLCMTALYKVNMKYCLTIAEITILADIPYPLHPSKSTVSFISPFMGSMIYDLKLDLVPVEELTVRTDICYKEARRVYVGSGRDAGTYFSCYPDAPPYAFVLREKTDSSVLRCEYLPGNEKYMDYARNLITLMDIEATLLDFGSLIFHSSLVRWNNKGILFVASSGTGKSTQASLWEKYAGAEVLNGDRAAIRKIDGIWKAYGLPYAGTSGIYRNESAPVAAIVALRQSENNHIRRINGAEAFRSLYPETMIHRWDPTFENKASDLLLTAINEIPVFLLECRPDCEAVKILKTEVCSLMEESVIS